MQAGALITKLAITEVDPATETVQLAVPEQAPLHPEKIDPELATAVSVTEVPLAKLAVLDEQVEPQLIPVGELVTVPEPVPAFVTVKLSEAVPPLKLAATAAYPVTVHVDPDGLGHPVQPSNVAPLAGTAVRVTVVPDE